MVIPPDNDNHKQQSRVGSGALRRGSQKTVCVCVDLVSIGSAFGQQDVFKLRFTQIVDPNRIKPQFGAH